MEMALQTLLPSELPPDRYLLVSHEGKKDLDASIPRKLRSWQEPGVSFVIVRDCHAEDCRKLKSRLKRLCEREKRPTTLVRIVCRELESWFLGDLEAVAKAFGRPGVAKLSRKRKFRDPDSLANASDELRRLVPEYQKRSGARAISTLMAPGRNSSHSFGVFWKSVRDMAQRVPKGSAGEHQ
jgi:hypothetical protein